MFFIKVVRSDFALVKKVGGKAYLYNSLTLKKAFADKKTISFFESFSKPIDFDSLKHDGLEIASFLLKGGFIINASEKGSELENFRNKFVKKNPEISLLYILPTNHCNLACKYCFIENSKPEGFRPEFMSSEAAKAAIETFAKVASRKARTVRIIFYGGEPLANYPIVKESIIRINDLKKSGKFPEKTQIVVISNGTLFTREIADFFMKNNVTLSFSLDGPKEAHDAMRSFPDGKGSFEKVINAIETYKNAGGSPFISCTLGKHNIGKMPGVLALFEKLKIKGIGFNIVSEARRKNGTDYRKATAEMFKAYERLSKTLGISEDKVNRKISAFVEEQPHIYDCGACGGQFAVSPNGSVGPCHVALESGLFSIGNILDKDIENKIFKSKEMLEWCSITPLNNKECKSCIALGICGGGCPFRSFTKYNSKFAVDRDFCEHSLYSIDWLFKKLDKGLKKHNV